MSVAIVSILLLKFADFDVSDKAKNAFLICPAISPARHRKDTFFFNNATLYKNIISSKVNKFL